MLCSERKLDFKLRKMKPLFMANDYAEWVITNTIGGKIAKFNGIKMLSPFKCPVYIKLSWIGPRSQVYADKISSPVRRWFNAVYVQNNFSITRAFPSVRKDISRAYTFNNINVSVRLAMWVRLFIGWRLESSSMSRASLFSSLFCTRHGLSSTSTSWRMLL